MKIAYLISRVMKSGPINQSLNILKGLKNKNGIDVTLLTFDKEIEGETWLPRFIEAGIKVHQFNLESKNIIVAARKLSNYVKNEKIDIIHGCGTRVDLIAYLAGTKAKKIITHRSYPDMIAEGKPELLRKLVVPLYMHVMKSMDKVIACSYSMQEAFKVQCKMNLAVVQNAVDTDFFRPLNKGKKLENKKILGLEDLPTFLVLGSLSSRKNNAVIIDAINQMDDFYGQLLFVGSGPEENFLKEKAKNNSRIHFVGSTLTPIRYLQVSDFLISASTSEGLPNSVLEAISCGLIPILSNIDPHREIVENSDINYLFDPMNSLGLAERIIEVKEQNLDELSKKARSLAESNFGIDTMSNKYITIYNRLLSNENS